MMVDALQSKVFRAETMWRSRMGLSVRWDRLRRQEAEESGTATAKD
jgi:hypothetical protein